MPAIAELPTSRRGLIMTLASGLAAWLAALAPPMPVSGRPKAQVRSPQGSVKRAKP
ncbi:MAG: hypothetical protein HY924_05860 [Elusimicrobia bacterium]|nr:hypothetical protein [Elusimicrobiota bacterium]